MGKTFIIEVEVPAGLMEGDKFKVEVEMPERTKKTRGVLAGISVAEMTDDQLKRELINANSVLYKAKQRGASAEVIAANEARVEAVKAERDRRGLNTPKPAAVKVTPIVETPAETGVYADEQAATEI